MNNPIRFLLFTSLFMWLSYSYMIFAIEREYMPEEFTLRYSFWHTVLTLTTLGGNFTPSTEIGKSVTIITALSGICLETVFVVTILENVALSHYQNIALNFLEKRDSENLEVMRAMSEANCKSCRGKTCYSHRPRQLSSLAA